LNEKMKQLVDLHVHSNESDGSYSPADVIDFAVKAGVSAVALTDHDTIAGLAAAACRAADYPQLSFIPGIEISAEYSPGIMHILGLGVNPTDAGLNAVASRLRESRANRNPQIIEKLRSLGVDISFDEVLEESRKDASPDAVLGRLHIAMVLVKKGFARNIADAFEKFLGNHAPAYVPKDHLLPAQAVAAINSAGGTAILAHPVQLECANELQLETLLRKLMHVGLGGMECYHSSHNDVQTRTYLRLAQKLGLIITGGSDYHGLGKPDVAIGRPPVPMSIVGEKNIMRWRGQAAGLPA